MLLYNLHSTPLVLILALTVLLFISSVGNIQATLKMVISHSIYVLLKSILMIPVGLAALIQLKNTPFDIKNPYTIVAIVICVMLFLIIPIWATTHADKVN